MSWFRFFTLATAVTAVFQGKSVKSPVDSAVTLFPNTNALTTTNALDYLTSVPIAQQCIPAIAEVTTTNIPGLVDVVDPALLNNSKIDPKIYKKIKNSVVEGTEEQILNLSEMITALNHLPQYRSWIRLALTDDHPLFIFFVDEADLNSFLNRKSSGAACYFSATNTLLLTHGLRKEDIRHELRHRVWHVVHTRVSGRFRLLSEPYYNERDDSLENYQSTLEQGDQRIHNELATLFALEQADESLSSTQLEDLEKLRAQLLDDNGKPFSIEIDLSGLNLKQRRQLQQEIKQEEQNERLTTITLINNSFSFRLIHRLHFTVISNFVTETGVDKIYGLITDPIAATLYALHIVRTVLADLYEPEERPRERDAYMWQIFSVNLLNKLYPEYLKETNDLIKYASKFTNNKIKYQISPQVLPEIIMVKDDMNSDKFQETTQVNANNAEVAFCTGLHKLFNNPQDAEKIFKILIKKGFFMAESLIELASLSLGKNQLDKAFEYFKQAEAEFQLNSRRIGFTVAEWNNYAYLNFVTTLDFQKSEKIYMDLIKIVTSEKSKEDVKERLKIMTQTYAAAIARFNSQSATASRRP